MAKLYLEDSTCLTREQYYEREVELPPDPAEYGRNQTAKTKSEHVGVQALAASVESEDWMSSGLCTSVPPETFFPSDGAGVAVARKVCKNCVVREDCLDYALTKRIDHGVWGGASERERRRILKRRRVGA